MMMTASSKKKQTQQVTWHSITGCIRRMEKLLSSRTKIASGLGAGQKSVLEAIQLHQVQKLNEDTTIYWHQLPAHNSPQFVQFCFRKPET